MEYKFQLRYLYGCWMQALWHAALVPIAEEIVDECLWF